MFSQVKLSQPISRNGGIKCQRRNITIIDESKRPVIVSAKRTPIGAIQGSLSHVSAPELGAAAIKAALEQSGISPKEVKEVFFGNVISASLGQAPARQAALHAGLLESTVCTTVNKVCASGLKAVISASQSILLGDQNVVVAGGMESMSNAPFYVLKARQGLKYGHGTLKDSLLQDGLTDAYSHKHMGQCAEETAKKYTVSREEQDAYALESYKRASIATEQGLFKKEIVPISVTHKGKQSTIFDHDEEHKNIKLDKVTSLKPAFIEQGTITAANSSTLSDGASALVLMSREKATALGLKPIARVLGYGEAAHAPVDFATAPSLAIPIALKHAGINQSQVDFWEINEAFSVVNLANMKILGIDHSKMNIWGGAVSLGHPIGSSGARILVTLTSVLKEKNATIGVASICNGGGGSSTVVIERL